MATPLTGSKQIIYDSDVDFNSTNSEAIQTKLAKAALFSQDISEYPVNFEYAGYFQNSSITTGAARFVVTKRSEIKRYILSIGDTGTTSACSLSVKVYDSSGAFVNDLFSSSNEPSILTPTAKNNSYIGKDVFGSVNLSGNVSGATIDFGTINLTILEEGYQLVGEIISNGIGARNANLSLILQRIE